MGRACSWNLPKKMKLQYAAFSLPLHSGSVEQEELNRFFRGHRIVQTRKELVAAGDSIRWAILVEYIDAPGSEADDQQ